MNAATDFLRVSYSSLNVLSSCQRKFEFQKLYPSRKREDAFAADVGTALHRGYQDFLIHQDETKAIWEFMQAYPYSLEYEQKYDDRSLEACLSTLEEMFESAEMTNYELAQIRRPLTDAEAQANVMALEAGNRMPYDPSGIIVPAIEVPFEIRFNGITLPDGRGIAFVGFMDAIMRNRLNGLYRTTDIKTHRRTLKDATAKYKFDDQQTPYGIIVEHMQGNPVDEFEVMYLDCYVDLVEPRVSVYNFMRDKDDTQEWLMNKVFQFQSIQRSMEMDYFPRTSGGCMVYNKPCYYLDVCESRNREMIESYLLNGDEPAPPRYEVPWVVAEIDVMGNQDG